MGGTNLYIPLKSIFEPQSTGGLQTLLPGDSKPLPEMTLLTLFVLTDGEHNTSKDGPTCSDILNVLRLNAGKFRVFWFGMGAGVGKAFLKALARITSGKAEFIGNKESMVKSTIDSLSNAFVPCWSNIRLTDHRMVTSGSRKQEQGRYSLTHPLSPTRFSHLVFSDVFSSHLAKQNNKEERKKKRK
jgi:hypothetical protein